MSEQCWGVIGISVDDRHATAVHIQELLTDYGNIIMGRSGVPLRDRHVSIISLIIFGAKNHADDLAAKLSALPGVTVTHSFSPIGLED